MGGRGSKTIAYFPFWMVSTKSPRLCGFLVDARNPLMLSLIVHAYWDLSARDLAAEDATSAAARRKHIMDAYIAHKFRRHGAPSSGGGHG